MGGVTPIKNKKKDICQFCGEVPDHPGYWQCPRLKTVAMDADGSWTVDFRDPELEIEFTPQEDEPDDESQA